MIRIEINHQTIDLGDNFSFSLEENYDLLEMETFGKVFSLPFAIPNNPHNKKLFAFPESWIFQTTIKKYPADLYLYDSLYDSGYIRLEKANKEEIAMAYISGATDLKDTYGTQSIREVFADDTVLLNTVPLDTYFKEVYNISGADMSFTITINRLHNHSPLIPTRPDPGTYEENQAYINAVEILVNTWVANIKGIAVNLEVYTAIKYNSEEDPNDFYIQLVLEDPQGTHTITNHDAYLAIDRITGLEAYLPVDKSLKLTFPMTYYEDFYEGKNTYFDVPTQAAGANKTANRFDHVLGEYKYHNRAMRRWYNEEDTELDYNNFKSVYTLVPFVYNSFILEQIFVRAGYSVGQNDLQGHELDTLILGNNKSLDHFPENNETSGNYRYYMNTLNPEVRIGDHIPDFTVSEYLSNLRKNSGITYLIDNVTKTVNIRLIKNRIAPSTPYVDFTNVSDPNPEVYPNTYEGITFSYPNNEDFPDYVLGEGKFEISSGFGVPPYLLDNNGFHVPVFEKGRAAAFEVDNENTPMLLFYRGLVANEFGNMYPCATYHNEIKENIPIPGAQISLTPGNDQVWSGFINFIQGYQKVVLELLIDISTLSLLHPEKHIRIEPTHFIMGKKQFTISGGQVMDCELELYST